MGVNTFLGALWRCPHYSLFTGFPQDIMHVWFEGIVRNLLGAIAYFMDRHWDFPIADAVEAMRHHASKQHDFPHVNTSRRSKLREGAEGGCPQTDCEFPGTCIQVAHLIMHAPKIWGPHLSNAAKKSLPWQVLLLQSHISKLLWQRSFTFEDIASLDKYIWLHDKAWLGSPDLFPMWKPKNHYLSHVPLDILRWGPPRGYWCIPFEHENQFSKSDASHSNFANICQSVAEGKALRVALEAYERTGL